MKYIKLNKNWDVALNVSELDVLKTEEAIEFSFLLDSIAHQHIDKEDKGTLTFFDVYAYRIDSISKKEYDNGRFRFKSKQLPWGAFYELKNSNWNNTFPDDKIILDDSIKKNKLRHFVFFLHDNIFECLALEYKFTFMDTISDTLEENYPKGYFNHFLSMFAANFDTASIANFTMYIDLYLQMEGKKEFADLKKEISVIKANNNLGLYLKFINYREIENFGQKQLEEMIKVIEKYKVLN